MKYDARACKFNMDTGSVELLLRDGRKISIDCTGVEDALDVTMAQRSELDYLIYNDPLGYADLILNGDLEEYLKNAAGSYGLEAWPYYKDSLKNSSHLYDKITDRNCFYVRIELFGAIPCHAPARFSRYSTGATASLKIFSTVLARSILKFCFEAFDEIVGIHDANGFCNFMYRCFAIYQTVRCVLHPNAI